MHAKTDKTRVPNHKQPLWCLPSADLFQATLYIPCLAALLVPSAVQSKVPMFQVNE